VRISPQLQIDAAALLAKAKRLRQSTIPFAWVVESAALTVILRPSEIVNWPDTAIGDIIDPAAELPAATRIASLILTWELAHAGSIL
jgi:hypothetical protein